MLPPRSLDDTIEAVIREEWGRILSILTKDFRDIQLAEDSLQDAIEAGFVHWKTSGLPKSPIAWLVQVARRKALDRIKRQKTATRKAPELSYLQDLEATPKANNPDALPDKRLEMIFTCCHPALAEKTRIALTLRTIGGLTTEEIAAAFLDTPRAMGQRLSRAKAKIRKAGIPYMVPDKTHLPGRLKGVLAVIYLIFNEGYLASTGPSLTRTDLVAEAIRLARIMNYLLPNTPEIEGLLALMLLHDARAHARVTPDGKMIALEFQNRNLWDRNKITSGTTLIRTALARGQVGPYQIQAAISALHNEATTWEDTDWPQIVALYTLLSNMQSTPVVHINTALAKSYAVSPQAGLTYLEKLSDTSDIAAYQPYHAARADLLLRTGQKHEATAALKTAIALSTNEAEKEFLTEKLK